MLLEVKALFAAQPRLVPVDAIHAQQVGLDECLDLMYFVAMASAGEMHISIAMWYPLLLELCSDAACPPWSCRTRTWDRFVDVWESEGSNLNGVSPRDSQEKDIGVEDPQPEQAMTNHQSFRGSAVFQEMFSTHAAHVAQNRARRGAKSLLQNILPKSPGMRCCFSPSPEVQCCNVSYKDAAA